MLFGYRNTHYKNIGQFNIAHSTVTFTNCGYMHDCCSICTYCSSNYILMTEMKYVSTKLLSVPKHQMMFMLTTGEMVGYSQGMS